MLLSMSVFGADRQNCISPILAFSMREGPPAACETFCVKTKPSMNSVSSTVPPSFLHSRISVKSTFVAVLTSMTFKIASTAMGASLSAYCETTLEFKDVDALCSSCSLSFKLTGMDASVKISSAFSTATRKASVIVCGWMPFVSSFSAACNKAPAMTTTEVVPSPASISCALDSSTIIFAVGCCNFICCKMVAPSLVITTSPFGS
mmetsp:Transcript_43180/g.99542  ORF Transcript_43180/g.99542 Transcript_43180/m.99542 type:complete len:205 (-) Transcript_43180:219-833(-)